MSLFWRRLHFANAETNTFARREAVSALGRLKTPKAISILKRFLADSDPKVILQALRGLLYFRDREDVRNFLTPLCEHPNELIREHAIRELNGQRRDKSKVSDHAMSPDALKNVIVCADVGEALKASSRRIGTSDIHIAALLQCA